MVPVGFVKQVNPRLAQLLVNVIRPVPHLVLSGAVGWQAESGTGHPVGSLPQLGTRGRKEVEFAVAVPLEGSICPDRDLVSGPDAGEHLVFHILIDVVLQTCRHVRKSVVEQRAVRHNVAIFGRDDRQFSVRASRACMAQTCT